MKKLLLAFALLALVLPVQGAYVVRVSDLQYSPTPPNPIKVAGRVTSASPLKLNDGSGEITVVRTTAAVSDFLVVTGDWDGSLLTAAGAVEHAIPPAPCEMVYIRPGAFLMGNNGSEPYLYSNELPQHSVYLSGYWIGKYEVTRREYRQFTDAGGYSNPAYWSSVGWEWKLSKSRTEPDYWTADQDWASYWPKAPQPFTQTDYHPVVGVSYYEAEAYCAWAGAHLPTEAQWEKAARWTGSYPNVYPWGNAWDSERCNNYYDHSAAGGGYERYQTAPVGSYPSGASPYGLQDMAGNVWEWCRDWYSSRYYSVSPSTDPQGPSGGSHRVLRGGGWYGSDSSSRCATRGGNPPYGWDIHSGFRVAR